jgi:hypothetical protein
MKKSILLIAVFLLAAVISHAQTEKGNQTLGFNLQYSYNNNGGININPFDNSITNTNNKYTVFSIGPAYSYFIADKLDLGATLSFGQTTYNYSSVTDDIEKQVTRNFDAMIYLRKYFMFHDNFGLRTGPFVAYTKSENTNTYTGTASGNDTDSKTNQYDAGLRLDMVYYPSKHLGLAATLANLDYSHSTTDNGAQGHTSGDGVNLAFINNGLSLSVFYVFGGK